MVEEGFGRRMDLDRRGRRRDHFFFPFAL